jgi:hypothetical protein
MEKPFLLLTQCTRNFKFAIRKKPLVSIGLMQHSPLVKLGDRKGKQLLLEDTTTVKYSFYRSFLMLWKPCRFPPLGLP